MPNLLYLSASHILLGESSMLVNHPDRNKQVHFLDSTALFLPLPVVESIWILCPCMAPAPVTGDSSSLIPSLQQLALLPDTTYHRARAGPHASHKVSCCKSQDHPHPTLDLAALPGTYVLRASQTPEHGPWERVMSTHSFHLLQAQSVR